MTHKSKIFLASNFVIFILCISIIAGVHSQPSKNGDDLICESAEASEAWSALVENFETLPFIIDQDTETVSDSVEPRISHELEERIRNASPESVVAYCPATGEVILIPYKTSE